MFEGNIRKEQNRERDRQREDLEKEKWERGLEKLATVVEKTASSLFERGVPVWLNGRVGETDEGGYMIGKGETPKEELSPMRIIRKREIEFPGKEMSKSSIKAVDAETDRMIKVHQIATALEMAEFVAFNKVLGENYLCVRSSERDDREAGVDKLIVQLAGNSKEENQLVGTIDVTTASESFLTAILEVKSLQA